MRNKPWDLFTVVYWDTDMVQHETWRLLDPSHPRHDAAEAAAYREQILDFHRKVDADVGRLLDEVGPTPWSWSCRTTDLGRCIAFS